MVYVVCSALHTLHNIEGMSVEEATATLHLHLLVYDKVSDGNIYEL